MRFSLLFYTLCLLLEVVFCSYWDVVFLGAGTCAPVPNHALSSVALRFENGEIFIFDVGEGTQVQLMKSILGLQKITRIFITHLHGDHVFGLPGLLSTIALNSQPGILYKYDNSSDNLGDEEYTVHIYGPPGIRSILMMSFMVSDNTKLKCEVHELVLPPSVFNWRLRDFSQVDKILRASTLNLMKGEDFFDNKDNVWTLYNDSHITIKAGLIKHKIPTFGFVVEEADCTGHLNMAKLKSLGIQQGPICKLIKQGQSFRANNGRIVKASEVIGPTLKGRKVTVLGDTSDPDFIRNLAMYDSMKC